jgi:GT2 family glycosyltransferase
VTDITVVIMTRDRVDELMRTLERLTALPESPPIIVADNGSSDGTSEAVAARFPGVRLLRSDDNLGVEGRNIAVREATTPYIAFNDDDSWWAPGALGQAVELFERHPRLGAITAHVVVEPEGRDDPTSLEMRDSPVQADPSVPGIPVLGFLACATAVRRAAFLEVGGFEKRLHFAGEEALLATDLAARGWQIRLFPELRVHHEASKVRQHLWRQRREVRNRLWYLWLRRPVPVALRRSWRLLRDARPGATWGGLAEAVLRGGWVVARRRVVPATVETELRRLEPGAGRPVGTPHAA